MRAVVILLLVLFGSHCCAQGVGTPAPDKTFLNSWNTPSGYTQLSDYFAAPGHVVLLDWWGAS